MHWRVVNITFDDPPVFLYKTPKDFDVLICWRTHIYSRQIIEINPYPLPLCEVEAKYVSPRYFSSTVRFYRRLGT